MRIVKVENHSQVIVIEKLAKTIWREHYGSLLSKKQIDYMLYKFQSFDAVLDAISHHGYEYYIMYEGDTPAGYIGIRTEEDRLFLSKLYLLKEYRGKGICNRAFDFMDGYCMAKGLNSIYLTCNKHNPTLQIYAKLGFEKIEDRVTDIGQGYVMDDYVLERRCK